MLLLSIAVATVFIGWAYCSAADVPSLNASAHFTAVIMGPPGGGKGTVSKKLQQQYNLHHISTGDALRDHVRRSTPVGLQAQDRLRRGELVSDDIMVNVIAEEVKKTPEDKVGVLLDGSPRTVALAEALEALMRVDLSIILDVPTEEIVARAKGRLIHEPSGRSYSASYNPPQHEGVDDVTGEPLVRRADDAPEIVTKRLNLYWSSVEPLMAFYAHRGKLLRASGETHPTLIKQDRRSDAIVQELALKFDKILGSHNCTAQKAKLEDDVNAREQSQAKSCITQTECH